MCECYPYSKVENEYAKTIYQGYNKSLRLLNVEILRKIHTCWGPRIKKKPFILGSHLIK